MDVVFAVMPFADVDRPSIGVSLLKARIASLGCSSRIAYFNLDLAEQLGYEQYRRISGGISMNSVTGEWFFADSAFGSDVPPEYEYVNKILSRGAPQQVVRDIVAARHKRQAFIARCAESIIADRPLIVGFSTTFDQTCACLAVAKAIKARANPPIVIFGGANCEGEMGHQLIQSVPWIDFVCTGEGDDVFPQFVENVLKGREDFSIPGILQQGKAAELTAPEVVHDLDRLPIPDYSDYVSQIQGSSLKQNLKPTLLIESSRGCWWGAKQHCTFCGLNGRTMGFRSKSVDRVFDELSFLTHTYGIKSISGVDNILDVRYIATLFPRLRDSGLDLDMFYEVKANLRFEQLALLRAGGVTAIQPGIESFSNDVLRRMKKGCTGLQNLQILRWSQEIGITVAWNLLGGFPGEDEAAYREMAALMPLFIHLPPPVACGPIRLDRFSPFFTNPEAFGMQQIRPTPAYYYCFPFNRRELKRLAYYFDFDYADGRQPLEYMRPVQVATNQWWEARMLPTDQQPRLDAEWLASDELVISDTRPCAIESAYHFSGDYAHVYAACDSVQSVSSVVRALGHGTAKGSVKSMLEHFMQRKLMVEMEDHYLSLAVVKNRSSFMTGEWSDNIAGHETASSNALLRVV
jgi:ribosomal peptide maturation radical SAM protein 1